MYDIFFSINEMHFLAPTLDNADPLFAVVIMPGFYMNQVELADLD